MGRMVKEKTLRKVNRYMEENHMELSGKTLVVGLSGGADSVCLFHILCMLIKKWDFSLLAAHVNHGIRETALRDEQYVESLCKAYGVRLEKRHIDCEAIAKEKGLSVEEAGRIKRYEFFNELAGDDGLIAVAHHLNDQAETVLFNMARGTSLSGLAGIKPVNGNIIRPLLSLSKEEILAYIEENNLEYMTDETNLIDKYSRNKLRLSVIPNLVEINAKACEHIAMMASDLNEIEDYIAIQKDLVWDKYVSENDGEVFISDKIIGEHRVVVREVIHQALCMVAGKAKDIGAVHIAATCDLFSSEVGRKIDLIYGITVERSYEGISLYKGIDKQDNCKLKWDIDRVSIEEKTTSGSQGFPKETYTKWVDCDKIKGSLCVRTRKTGDYLVVNDKGGKKLLKDYFIDEKIPRQERDFIPLVAAGDKIIWVVGGRISEDVKIDDNTKTILELKYKE